LILAEAVRQVRSDVRLLTNRLLAGIPELGTSCFFVDPFGGPGAASRSRTGLRAAHLWLRGGGALIMFPSGEVAWQAAAGGRRRDADWLPTLGRLALSTQAAVVPAFIDAANSAGFYAVGRIHPLLRTAMLGRELLNKRHTSPRIRVGPTIVPSRSTVPVTAEMLTKQCRDAVDRLVQPEAARPADIAPPVDASLLAADVDALPAAARLLTSGAYDTYCADAASIPHVLREIGRLRELTFRVVGEGTGRSTDLDRFDPHYQHLFVWNRVRREVVGAYRVGATDRILTNHGLAGLYTTTLFRYDERLLRQLGPALELGRSFVRAEYQRSYNALLLLWKGIGLLVARTPRYRVLFGPVSISARYQDTSQQLLRAFLAQEHGDAALSELVEPRNPPGPLAAPARELVAAADVDALDALIARIEGRQGIPVLLRQYMRLNATLLGFNLDPAFGDALDALMMVDLMRLPDAMLGRYLGREAAAFRAHHERIAA
jgi:putative hemolysin